MSGKLQLIQVQAEPDGYLEIAASSAALHELADVLRHVTDEELIPVLSIGTCNVTAILVRRVDGMATVQYESGRLRIEGGGEKLDVLADNIDFVADGDPSSDHIHIEHYPDHPYLDAHSQPVVVVRHGDDR